MRRYTLCKCCLGVLLLLFLLVRTGCLPWDDPVIPGGPVTVYGTVTRMEARENDSHQRQIILSLCSVTFCSGTFPKENNQKNESGARNPEYAEGIVCYLADGEQVPLCGERVVLSGKAEPFRARRNPGGFHAAAYYRAHGALFVLKQAVILRRGNTYNGYGQFLLRCREYMAEKLEAVCGEDAGIMQAILLGDKAFLPEEVKKLYQKGGISHILAISGLHISFLGVGLYQSLKKLRLPVAAAGSCTGLVLFSYVLMTGGSPSSWRAATMFFLSIMAQVSGRSYERLTALSVSALLLAVRQPLLLEQSGFLLSYGAILGLALICPLLEQLWQGRLIRLFLAGISITVVTLPIHLLFFYEFPIYSFFLNLLVIPLMGLVMALGLLALLAGILFLPMGKLLFFPVHLLLRLFALGCSFTDRLPGNLWLTGEPAPAQILMYYSLVLLFCLLGKYAAKISALLFLAGGVWILSTSFNVWDTVTILDVGQGDSILLRSRDGGAILVDCGSTSEQNLAEYTLLPCLKSQGIDSLDAVFLTHMDADHISGVMELLQDEETGSITKKLILPAIGNPDEAYRELVFAARRAEIPIYTIGAGACLEKDGFSIQCLHPRPGGIYADRNAGSLVLYIQKDRFSALLTGDLDGAAEKGLVDDLMQTSILSKPITLLKAGHHGSGNACGTPLLSLCTPQITVISCGEKNRYGHPDKGTLERIKAAGSNIYITKDTGAVRIYLRNGRVQITSCL